MNTTTIFASTTAVNDNCLEVTADQLESWMIKTIASQLKITPEEIDPNLPFSYYGLDSVATLGLSGELEKLLQRKLEPTLTWDYPSISQLAEFLALV